VGLKFKNLNFTSKIYKAFINATAVFYKLQSTTINNSLSKK